MRVLNFDLVGGLALLVSASCILFMWVSSWRAAQRDRQEISRFPMFAARDRLVALVALGAVSESEPAWIQTYNSVSDLLHAHERLHLTRVLWRYSKYLARAFSDPAERRRLRTLEDQIGRLEKRCPAFGEVLSDVRKAFYTMVAVRTGPLGFLTAFLALFVVTGAFGLTSSIRVFLAIRRPSSDYIAGFCACS